MANRFTRFHLLDPQSRSGLHGTLPDMAKTRFRITFTDGQTREYEDPITFDFPGTALKVFNGRERTGVGTIYYSPTQWKTLELIK